MAQIPQKTSLGEMPHFWQNAQNVSGVQTQFCHYLALVLALLSGLFSLPRKGGGWGLMVLSSFLQFKG